MYPSLRPPGVYINFLAATAPHLRPCLLPSVPIQSRLTLMSTLVSGQATRAGGRLSNSRSSVAYPHLSLAGVFASSLRSTHLLVFQFAFPNRWHRRLSWE